MSKRISLLLPTRGRPNLVQRFLQSVAAQSTHPELIEVILCIDEDDGESHNISFEGLALKLIIGPRRNMGAYNAECLEHATGDITIAVNDDVVVRTNGWDDKVRALDARFPDGIYLGYGNDLLKGSKLCTFPILSRKTCKMLTEPYPRAYKGAFIDVHLMDIFRRLEKRGHDRICYVADIVFEHVHYRTNPDALDATYSDRSRFGDDLTFIELADARRVGADRLWAHITNASPKAALVPPQIAIEPPNLIGIVPLCARHFLLDFGLPLGWRSRLFLWMIARHYVSQLNKVI